MSRLSVPLLTALLIGCGAQPYRDGAPRGHVDVDSIPDAVPKHEPRSKYGNPTSYEQFGKTYHTLQSSHDFMERGIASWYGTKFHGRRTSSGEDYNMYLMTAAHKTLPLPSYAEVTNLDNGRRIVVKINDRGPFHEDRIIDLSYAAAIKLGINKTGTGRVEIRTLEPGGPPPALTVQALEPSSVRQMSLEPIPTALEIPKPVISTNNSSQLYLQVGAFNSLANAENLRQRLRKVAGNSIKVISNAHPTQPIYRVRIGPLANNQAAQQLASRLENQGINHSNLVFD